MSGFTQLDLINLIKARPPLYNKDLLVNPRKDHKHSLWLEVAEHLTPAEDWVQYSDVEKDATIDQIQAKWKHIKDHFHRELKLIEAGEAHKKRKYVYFDEMEFMRPFVGYKLVPSKRVKKMEAVEFLEEFPMDAENEMVSFSKPNDEEEEDYDDQPLIKRMKSNQPKQTSSAPSNKKFKKEDILRKTSSNPKGAFKIRDVDISFCLSLVPQLRKLTESKKLLVKMEILKVLYKHIDHNNRNNSVTSQNYNNSSENVENQEDSDMQELYLDDMEETGDGVFVKNEDYTDSANSTGGSNKTWWT